MLLSKLKKSLPVFCAIVFILSTNSLCSQEQPDAATQEQWHTALLHGDLEKVRHILDQFPGLLSTLLFHAPIGANVTPLGLVAYHNHLPLAQFLLSRGADIDQRQYAQATALHTTCFSPISSAQMVDLLVKNGAAFNARDQHANNTPLHWCSDVARARILIEHGANIEAASSSGYSPVHAAAADGNPELIAYYLRLRPEFLHMCNHRKRTLLYRAAQCNKKANVEAILAAGADVNAQDHIGQTALHIAATAGHHETIETLLKSYPDVHAKDDAGQTALHIAADASHRNPHPFLPQIPQEQRPAQRRAAVKALLQYGTPMESDDVKLIRALQSADFDPEKIILDARARAYKELLKIQSEYGTQALPRDLEGLIIAFVATPKLPAGKQKENR